MFGTMNRRAKSVALPSISRFMLRYQRAIEAPEKMPSFTESEMISLPPRSLNGRRSVDTADMKSIELSGYALVSAKIFGASVSKLKWNIKASCPEAPFTGVTTGGVTNTIGTAPAPSVRLIAVLTPGTTAVATFQKAQPAPGAEGGVQ